MYVILLFYYVRMSRRLEVPRHRTNLTFIYFSVSAALCMVQYSLPNFLNFLK